MKLLKKEEIVKITNDNLHSDTIKKIMRNILHAANNGEWSLTYKESEYNSKLADKIKEVFTELGYEVTISTFDYAGILKQGLKVKIKWLDT